MIERIKSLVASTVLTIMFLSQVVMMLTIYVVFPTLFYGTIGYLIWMWWHS